MTTEFINDIKFFAKFYNLTEEKAVDLCKDWKSTVEEMVAEGSNADDVLSHLIDNCLNRD